MRQAAVLWRLGVMRPAHRRAPRSVPPPAAVPASPRRVLGAAQPARRVASTVACAPGARPSEGKKRLVFLGTPAVAAGVLEALVEAAAAPSCGFEVVAVVSQPPAPTGRGRKKALTKSAVHEAALRLGFEDAQGEQQQQPEASERGQGEGSPDATRTAGVILTPASARDDSFLSSLEALEPDICVTAAYGQFLPQRFLDAPPLGTLNVHPSLLPQYRGAAPVQRAVADGLTTTGVSVAYTVLAMDAGPVLKQEEYELGEGKQRARTRAPSRAERAARRRAAGRVLSSDDGNPLSSAHTHAHTLALDRSPLTPPRTRSRPRHLGPERLDPPTADETAPEALATLFERGTALLLEALGEGALEGEGAFALASPQDGAAATPADKITLEEGVLCFRTQTAADCHSRCKAFAGWPGTRTTLEVVDEEKGQAEELSLKVLETRRVPAPEGSAPGDVTVTKKAVTVTCACGGGLRITRLQTPNKKPMDAPSFVNGLRGRALRARGAVEGALDEAAKASA